MSSGSWTLEIATTVPARRLFKAAILDWHKTGPKILPEFIAGGSNISGDGGPGSVREIKFTSALPFSFVKERLDFVDHEKFDIKSTHVEGGYIGKTLESASTHFKFEPSEGGCVVKVVGTYKILPGVAPDEGEIVKGKEAVTGHIKAAEAYLLANPTAYA